MKEKRCISFGLLFLTSMLMILSACAPTMVSVSQPPDYYPSTTPIAMTVGIVIDEHHTVAVGKSRIAHPYGPQVVDELRRMRVFSDISYPYAQRSADAVLFLTMNGSWQYSNKGRAIANFLFGTPNYNDVAGITNVNVKLARANIVETNNTIIEQELVIDTKGQYTGTDTDSIANRLNVVQVKKIAVAIADLLQNKRAEIIDAIGQAGSATTDTVQKSASEERPSKQKLSADDPSITMNNLEQLRESGLMSDEDYQKARKRLEKLNELDELHRNKILSDEEYTKAKKRLLEK
jgi:Short C-terminal domain